MQIRFSPPWEVQPNIDKGAAVKSVELLQAGFFNWLYDCPNGFSSIIIPEVSRSAIYKALMAPPVLPGKYYDQVLRLVESGEKVSLDDLYGETIPCRLRWVFTQRGDTIVASFAEAKSGSGFLRVKTTLRKRCSAQNFLNICVPRLASWMTASVPQRSLPLTKC